MDQQRRWFVILFVAFLFVSQSVHAQTCATADELDTGKKAALTSAVDQYFKLAQQNPSALTQYATPDFTQIAATVDDNKAAFSGTPTLQSLYLLENGARSSNGAFSGPPKSDTRAEFFCGVFNSSNRVGFVFSSLAAGDYAVLIQDTKSEKGSYSLSWILQQSANRWLVAGLIVKGTSIGTHDGTWFIQQARAYKAKGQSHNAWLYYVMGDELLRPFPAMSTPELDKLYDEFGPIRPSDLPGENPLNLLAAGKNFKVTTMFPAAVGNDIDLVVKYQTSDLSNTAKVYQDNTDVIKGVVTKYPELREAFAGVVARAVAPSGQDYGTLLAMKDVK